MKIDTGMEILDLAGVSIKDGEGNLLLKTVLTGALVGQPQGEVLDGATSAKKLNLALRIAGAKTVELSVKEIELLMTLVGKMYMPLVAGRVWHILDPTTRGEA